VTLVLVTVLLAWLTYPTWQKLVTPDDRSIGAIDGTIILFAPWSDPSRMRLEFTGVFTSTTETGGSDPVKSVTCLSSIWVLRALCCTWLVRRDSQTLCVDAVIYRNPNDLNL
jgi:hypothetical protein